MKATGLFQTSAGQTGGHTGKVQERHTAGGCRGNGGKDDGDSGEGLYCKLIEGLADEIRLAESCIERYARYYHAHEADCPADFKLLMLVNGWHNPFIALNELLRRIYDNEMLMKRERKRTGIKPVYKSRYRELEELVKDNGLRKQDGEMETDNS